MWRLAVVGSASVLCFITTANAGDSGQTTEADPNAMPPQVSWAGFYIGANGGYGRNARHPDLQIVDLASNVEKRLGAACVQGGFGGVQVGYSWQGVLDPHLVLGIEADLEYAAIGATLTASPAAPSLDALVRAHTNLDSFGALMGRLGYAWDRALFYAAVGLAFADAENTVLYNDSLGQRFSLDKSTTRTGYVAGGGVELILTPNWSSKVEYKFLSLESLSASGNFAGGTVTDPVRTSEYGHDYHMIRAGLNYHVGATYQPLK